MIDQLSKHFLRQEFKCRCGECMQDTVDAELITVLERVREWANAPIKINSGNRCAAYNKKIGGSPASQHLRSRAADIVVEGKTPFQVYRRLEDWYPSQYGMGRYNTFTHIDTRKGRARWKG